MFKTSVGLTKTSIIALLMLGFSINTTTKAGHNSVPSYGECYHFQVNKWGFRVMSSYLGPKSPFYSCSQLYQQQVIQEHNNGIVSSKAGSKAYHPEYKEHMKMRADDPHCVIDTHNKTEPNL